jgi:hypothetical protein
MRPVESSELCCTRRSTRSESKIIQLRHHARIAEPSPVYLEIIRPTRRQRMHILLLRVINFIPELSPYLRLSIHSSPQSSTTNAFPERTLPPTLVSPALNNLLTPLSFPPRLPAKMSQELTYADVRAHNTKKDLFVVIHDKVYNASSFVDEHPYVVSPSLPVSVQRNSRA